MSRICVIIPCYKNASTLGDALDSVLAQSRLPDEILVVNDCSPESQEIEEVLGRYPSVRYIKNTVNLGLAATRNEGVKNTESDIISFLDADDQLNFQKIERQVSVLKSGVALSCAVSRIGYLESNISLRGEVLSSEKIYTFTKIKQNIFKNHLTGPSIMIYRDDFLKVGGYESALRSAEDFDLWLRLLEVGVEVNHLLAPLYLYRMNPEGLSQNTVAISGWEMKVVKRALGRMGYSVPYRGFAARVMSVWVMRQILRNRRERSPELQDRIARSIQEIAGGSPWRFALGLLAQTI